MQGGRNKLKNTKLWTLLFYIILTSCPPLTVSFSVGHHHPGQSQNSTDYPVQRKSNLEMLLSLAPAFMHSATKFKERGVIPVTHEEEDPLPITSSTTTTTTTTSTTTSTTTPAPEIVKASSLIPLTESLIQSSSPGGGPLSSILTTLTMSFANTSMLDIGTTSSSMEGDISSVKEDQPRPMTNFQNIKDAYFDLLKEFKEFRKSVSLKIATLEHKLEVQIIHSNNSEQMDTMSLKMGDMYDKMIDIDLRHNLTRLMDLCVDKIMAEDIMDAISIWQRIQMIPTNVPNPIDLEPSTILKEIVASAYIKQKTNSNPVFLFLRKLQDAVDKYPAYEYLLNGMLKSSFNGPEIFHIAQYLKEHNAVRSSLYSRIPKSVQYAVSGRNVNIIYFDEQTSRNYLHVKDDGNRRGVDRHNVYVKASQSYTDSKAAVWRTVYYPATETFRIRNVLFNDYMFVNDEGFVEITSMANANQLGTEFDFSLEDNYVVLTSKSSGQPLVSTWSGGRFPYYFSLKSTRGNEAKAPAHFLIEPDTLM